MNDLKHGVAIVKKVYWITKVHTAKSDESQSVVMNKTSLSNLVLI